MYNTVLIVSRVVFGLVRRQYLYLTSLSGARAGNPSRIQEVVGNRCWVLGGCSELPNEGGLRFLNPIDRPYGTLTFAAPKFFSPS